MTVQPIRIELPYGTPPLDCYTRLPSCHERPSASQRKPTPALGSQGPHHVSATPRMSDNLVPTLKVCADALVDHGTVPDDTPEYMTKHMPVIHPKHTTGQGHVWLELTIKENR